MLQQNGKLTATDSPRAVLDLFDNDVRGRINTAASFASAPPMSHAAAITMLLCGRFWAQSCRTARSQIAAIRFNAYYYHFNRAIRSYFCQARVTTD